MNKRIWIANSYLISYNKLQIGAGGIFSRKLKRDELIINILQGYRSSTFWSLHKYASKILKDAPNRNKIMEFFLNRTRFQWFQPIQGNWCCGSMLASYTRGGWVVRVWVLLLNDIFLSLNSLTSVKTFGKNSIVWITHNAYNRQLIFLAYQIKDRVKSGWPSFDILRKFVKFKHELRYKFKITCARDANCRRLDYFQLVWNPLWIPIEVTSPNSTCILTFIYDLPVGLRMGQNLCQFASVGGESYSKSAKYAFKENRNENILVTDY